MKLSQFTIGLLALATFASAKFPFWDAPTATRYINIDQATLCDPRTVLGWNCTAYCAKVPGFKPLALHYNSSTDHVVLVGVNPTFQEIVVSFPGTKGISLINWIHNLDIFSDNDNYPWYPSVEVHPGFLKVLMSHEGFLVPYITQVMKQYPTYQLVVTGHSLGGAVATLFAGQLFVQYGLSNFLLVTFGSPRVGDPTFRNFFDSTGIQHWRLTHGHDPVPHLPPSWFGFEHVQGEIWEVEHWGVPYFTICSDADGEDPDCSDGNLFNLDIGDHRSYMLVKGGQC